MVPEELDRTDEEHIVYEINGQKIAYQLDFSAIVASDGTEIVYTGEKFEFSEVLLFEQD